jgi:methyl-accepting chemotaxis protein
VAQLYRGIQDIERRTVATTQRIVELTYAEKTDEAWTLLWTEAKPQYEQWLAAINRLIDFEEKRIVGTTQSVVSDTAFEVLLIALIGLVGVVVGFLTSFLVYRRVTTEMGGDPATVRELLSHMREGNLTVSVPVKTGDRHSVMAALSDLRNRLGELIGVVRSSSDSISEASGEVAAGNQDLSGRTEAAASSLQETASSVEQLTATVRQSADSARQANQLASSAAEVAQRGGVVVNQVVSTMQDIHDSSRKISDIISVIDGIAFQTNILALNAAVEAARAGEQGRGFAVVAGEVRTLAQRSAQAAREISTLINSSVEKVQSGSRLVQDAGSTMSDIVTSVQRVTDVISEISAAADEQSHGIEQVNTAMPTWTR